MSIEVDQRRSLYSLLKPYCYHASEHDYMEITEWSNGAGFDINIARQRGIERFSLSYGEFELLQVLINYKGYED